MGSERNPAGFCKGACECDRDGTIVPTMRADENSDRRVDGKDYDKEQEGP